MNRSVDEQGGSTGTGDAAHQHCYGQFGEDLTIESVLRLHDKLANGFFVDVGAFHPWRYSNTARLYLLHGWRGLHIDANPEAVANIGAARPGDQTHHALIGEHGAEREYVYFNHPAVNSADAEVIAHQSKNPVFEPQRTEVLRERTLFEVIEPHLPSDNRPCLLSVDVEGMDLQVLRSNDWSGFRPFMVVVEIHAMNLHDPRANPIAEYLIELGYELVSHVFATSVFVDRSDPKAPVAFHQRYRAAVCDPDEPVARLRDLAAGILAHGEQVPLHGALVLGHIAIDLRDGALSPPALKYLESHLDNPWSRLITAQLEWFFGDHKRALDTAHRDVHDEPENQGLLNEWAALCARMGPEVVTETLGAFASTKYFGDLPMEWAAERPLGAHRLEEFTARIASRAGLDPALAASCVDVMVQAHEQGPRVRQSALPWHAADAFTRDWGASMEARIRNALKADEGFAYVRLGDGEGAVLRGTRPDLGGALGRRADGTLEELDEGEYEEFISAYLGAITGADSVGVADLGQCVAGPPEAVLPLAALMQAGQLRNVEVGSWHGHLGLETLGVLERLMPVVTGIIGPTSPSQLAAAKIPAHVQWLAVPGETHYYDATARRNSHWEQYYPRIMNHPFRPGELWLVGAGVLGKVYCAHIRACGGVALDVGSLMDLWSGHHTTRGEFRANLWLAAKYERRVAGG